MKDGQDVLELLVLCVRMYANDEVVTSSFNNQTDAITDLGDAAKKTVKNLNIQRRIEVLIKEQNDPYLHLGKAAPGVANGSGGSQ